MRRSVSVFLIFALLIVMGTAVYASGLTTGIQEKKKKLQEVNKSIEQKKEQLKQVKEEQSRITAQLEAIEEELRIKEEQLARTEEELATVQKQLDATRQQLQEAIDQINKQKNLMDERLRAMYMNRNSSYLELLLEARSLNEFIDRIEMIKQIIAFDCQMLQDMKNYRDKIDEKKKMLEEQERIIASTRQSLEKQKKEIEEKKKQRQLLLDRLADQQEAYEKDLDELEKTSKELEKKIQQLLKELERQKKSKAKYTGGKLAWPVPGFYRITSPFGYRIHPIYKVRRFHTGIDIGSNYVNGKKESIYGQNFVAAADGMVIFAGWYGGYGRCVIIDHGGGVTTLYAHGSRILVKTGQQVKRGQPVMKVGSSGASTGAHAHFEVRENGVPVDPVKYLK